MTEFITPKISDRLLRELPRFFGGFDAMLKEAFQNAYRAGAKNVTIIQDDLTLTIADDGVGLNDPQVLFTGGDTGWNEDQVIDPAGLGVFSYLNPDLVEAVTFMSRDWMVTVTPDILYRPIGEEAVKTNPAGHVEGFQVTVKLKKVSNIGDAIGKARGFYDFTVTLNGRVLNAKETLNAVSVVIPGYGTAHLTTIHPTGDNRPLAAYVMWEKQIIRDAEFSAQVEAVFKRQKIDWLLEGYGVTVIFEVDPTSGIRPKLPDRNALIHDSKTAAAAEMIPARLLNAVSTELRRVLADLPATFTPSQKTLGNFVGLGSSALERLMRGEGYDRIQGGYAGERYYLEVESDYEDGDRFEALRERGADAYFFYSREALVAINTETGSDDIPFDISAQGIAHTLNLLYVRGEFPKPVRLRRRTGKDRWSSVDTTDTQDPLEITVEVSKKAQSAYPKVVLVDRITADGTEIPYLLDQSTPALYYAHDGEIRQAIEELVADEDLVRQSIYVRHQNEDFDVDDSDVDYYGVSEDYRRELAKSYLGMERAIRELKAARSNEGASAIQIKINDSNIAPRYAARYAELAGEINALYAESAAERQAEARATIERIKADFPDIEQFL